MKSAAGILKSVREGMRANLVDAYIIPSSDAHNSEYVASHLQRRAFVTNFGGSAGTAVVTQTKALLWTDGRYWIEAAECMYPEFTLMKQGQLGVPFVEEWLSQELGAEAVVGINPYNCTIVAWDNMSESLHLRPVPDLVAPLMPGPPDANAPLYQRPSQYSGATAAERRAMLVDELAKQRCDLVVLSALDEIAWLTNLRGKDVPYNPVFYAYAIVDVASPKIRLYVEMDKLTPELRAATAAELDYRPYDSFVEDLKALPVGTAVLVDKLQTSQGIYSVLKERGMIVKCVMCGPAQKLKGVKNEVERRGFRECHVRDSVSVTRFLAWLHEEIAVKGVTTLNEYDAATQLEQYRASNDLFVQLSFGTISSSGPNAAMCHYQPAPTGSALVSRDELYLVDSGAQYLDGTTDVTRTVCFRDAPRDEESEAYTAVLKGHIALDMTVFPKGTSGHRLDALARHALWQMGLDYSHGTGHGVGSFLCVHEGPHSIGARPVLTAATLDCDCIVTNEPGYYKEGCFGIRIENVELVVPRTTKHSEKGFLGLEYLTLVPLCRELIRVELLTAAERQWVNTYHAAVSEALMPVLERLKDERAVAYLKHHTQPL